MYGDDESWSVRFGCKWFTDPPGYLERDIRPVGMRDAIAESVLHERQWRGEDLMEGNPRHLDVLARY